MNIESKNFSSVIAHLRDRMVTHGDSVKTETWQGKNIKGRPDAEMFELLNVSFCAQLDGIEDLDYYRKDIRPNLPWADDHFLERVAGEPLNPGKEWANWPWGKQAATSLGTEGRFNHNYMERYWPKRAGDRTENILRLTGHENFGIRHTFGDLNDVVELLVREPHTRQAYLPIFFPEDTGVGDGGRKPCTLGYQFMVRRGRLHVFYPMRSTDILRHFQDDIYLTVRLALWVLEQCRLRDAWWQRVTPGTFSMHMTSLHCFVNDHLLLRRERDQRIAEHLS